MLGRSLVQSADMLQAILQRFRQMVSGQTERNIGLVQYE